MSLLVYFAPLQGYTDVVYRKAHAALFGGIAAYYTPFVRIEKGDFRRKDLRDIDFENNRGVPVVPQAIASESDELRRIVDCMASLGYTRVDINLGCPFPILAYRHKGSGILPFPDEVERLLRPLESYDSLEFSVKMRWLPWSGSFPGCRGLWSAEDYWRNRGWQRNMEMKIFRVRTFIAGWLRCTSVFLPIIKLYCKENISC